MAGPDVFGRFGQQGRGPEVEHPRAGRQDEAPEPVVDVGGVDWQEPVHVAALDRFCTVGDELAVMAFGNAVKVWPHGDLTWSVDSTLARWNGGNPFLDRPSWHRDDPVDTLDRALAYAFAIWQHSHPTFFSFTQQDAPSDFTLTFGGTSLDPQFGAVDGKLAHGKYPTSGELAFDSSEAWDSFELVRTAVHEIGHALGFGHSNSTKSVMYPFRQTAPNGWLPGPLDQETFTRLIDLYGWDAPSPLPDVRTSSEGPALTTTWVAYNGAVDGVHMAWKAEGDDQRIHLSSSYDSGETWTAQHALNEIRSSTRPTLAPYPKTPGQPFLDDLFIVWKGEHDDQRLYYASDLVDGQFTRAGRIEGHSSTDAPAAAWFDGNLYVAWKSATTTEIYWSRLEPNGTWRPAVIIPGLRTAVGPTLIASGGSLVMCGRGESTDTVVWQITRGAGEGSVWTDPTFLTYASGFEGADATPSGFAQANTSLPMAVTTWEEGLLFAYRTPGIPEQVMVLRSGSQFSGPVPVPGAFSASAPALSQGDGVLLCAFRGSGADQTLYLSRRTDFAPQAGGLPPLQPYADAPVAGGRWKLEREGRHERWRLERDGA